MLHDSTLRASVSCHASDYAALIGSTRANHRQPAPKTTSPQKGAGRIIPAMHPRAWRAQCTPSNNRRKWPGSNRHAGTGTPFRVRGAHPTRLL